MNKNSGRVVAVCSSDTVIGSPLILATRKPVAVSNIAMPRFDKVLAAQMTANAKLAKAPQKEVCWAATVAAGASPSSLNPDLRIP